MKFIENIKQPIHLTPREKEVAELVSSGETNKDICEKLFITNHTLKVHLSNLYLKFGLSNKIRTEYSVKRLRFTLCYSNVYTA